jgi:peptidoglycan/xylan/chitin deacetylase (PgdA/CDA1 family)
VLERVSLTRPVVALTLDLGETATRPATQAILDYLAAHHLRCTFFVTGWFIRTYPDLLAQIVNQGHDLGNHTDTHPHCTKISSDRLKRELTTVEQLLADKSLAISTPKYWRPPYGEYDRQVVETAASLGYRTVLWSATSVDYNTTGNAEKEAQRILKHTGPGTIILCHTGPVSKQVVPLVVGPLLEKGYQFTTLEGLVEEGKGRGN